MKPRLQTFKQQIDQQYLDPTLTVTHSWLGEIQVRLDPFINSVDYLNKKVNEAPLTITLDDLRLLLLDVTAKSQDLSIKIREITAAIVP